MADTAIIYAALLEYYCFNCCLFIDVCLDSAFAVCVDDHTLLPLAVKIPAILYNSYTIVVIMRRLRASDDGGRYPIGLWGGYSCVCCITYICPCCWLTISGIALVFFSQQSTSVWVISPSW